MGSLITAKKGHLTARHYLGVFPVYLHNYEQWEGVSDIIMPYKLAGFFIFMTGEFIQWRHWLIEPAFWSKNESSHVL